jgi:hypothetical protein
MAKHSLFRSPGPSRRGGAEADPGSSPERSGARSCTQPNAQRVKTPDI